MTQATFNGGTGNWSDPASWNPSVVPNNGNQGQDYDVTFSTGTLTQDIVSGVTINQLFMSGGTLILANPLTLNEGLQFTGGSITSGILNTVGGMQSALMTVSNTTINNSGDYTLSFASGNLFSGSGSIFNNSGSVSRSGGTGGVTFNIALNNSGIFEVGTGTLTLLSANGVTNSGLLQANNGSLLVLSGSGGGVFTNTGGTIEALDGSEVQLTAEAKIVGGTLSTAGTGVIRANGSQNIFLTDLTNASNLVANDNSDLGLDGAITNTGTITFTSLGNATDLEVQNNGVTLAGGGTISFVGSVSGINSASVGTRLTNVDNLLQGQGRFGQNVTAFTNQANGVILANVSGGTLTIDPVADGSALDEGASFLNNGVLRASGGGILLLTGNGGGAFANNNQIEALDGSEVQLTTEVSITGGTLSTTGTGVIRANGSQNVFLFDLTNAGTLLANDNSDLGLGGTITNTGTITLTSLGNATDLEVQGDELVLEGGGTVTFAGSVAGINTATLGARLTNTDNLLQGQGRFGQNVTAFTNQAGGIILANVPGGAVTIDPVADGSALDGGASFVNNGILRASSGGVLLLTGSGGGAFTNNNLIEALDGSEVQLTTEVAITGGTLSTTGTGVIRANNSQNVFLTDLTNTGTLIANDNSDLGLSGAIVNSGSITLSSLGNATDLEVQPGGATLTGGGTVTLTGSVAGVNAITTGTRLTITDNLIQGQGRLGQNVTAFTNGTGNLINANVDGGTLTIDPSAVALDGDPVFLNNGTLRASNNSVLLLTGNGGGSFTNTNGLIEALADSEVQLTAGATVIGGTLSTTADGVIRANNGQDVFLTDLTNAGTLIANDNSDLGLSGTITNSGTISLNSLGNATDLEVQTGGVTLTGGGSVTLAGSTVAGINSATTGARLTNVNNLIQGQGRLGQNNTAFTNQAAGIIEANVNGAALTIDPVAENSVADLGPAFLNAGILRASNGGILVLTGNGGGAFTNNNLIEALDGSEVQLTGGVSITGGTLSTSGTGVIRANNSQDVFLFALTNAGALVANDNSDLGLGGTITNTVSIAINSLGNATDLEVQAGGLTLTGGGTVTFAGSSIAGLNSAVTGTRLTNVNNIISGQGRLGQNVTAFTNGAAGVIKATVSGATLTIDPVTEANVIDGGSAFLNHGILRAGNGGILLLSGNGGGAFTSDGTIEAITGGTLQFTGAVTSSGLVDVGSDTLSITGSGSYTQTAGTFRLAGGTVTSSTALNFVDGLVDARGTINASLTNIANLQPALGGSGLFVTGNVTLLSASRLTFQLGGLTQGSQYGFLNVNGTIALAGQLVVSFVNNFQATNGNNFTILSSTTLSGTFGNVASGSRVNAADGSGSFLVTYTTNNEIILSDFQGDLLVAGAVTLPNEHKTATPAAPALASAVATRASSDEPRALGSKGRGARPRATNPRLGLALQNTDQLRELMEGENNTTSGGVLTVHPAPPKAQPGKNRHLVPPLTGGRHPAPAHLTAAKAKPVLRTREN